MSNRVPAPGNGAATAGGLVSALLPALRAAGGLWFGWSGRTGSTDARSHAVHEAGVDYLTFDLTAEEVSRYYEGFANRTLWPVLHDLKHRAHAGEEVEYQVWRGVNRRFAGRLASQLQPQDLVFVQDYHLVPLGTELRRLGWGGRIGYFHHIPVPPPAGWADLPHAGDIAGLFDAYDLVGVQTPGDADRLAAIVGGDAATRVQAHPIGIDPDAVRAMAALHPGDTFAADHAAPLSAFQAAPGQGAGRLRPAARPALAGPSPATGPPAGDRTVAGRRVFFGVDRLDYTKGIPWRLVAYEQFLQREPARALSTRFVQWAAPSRETIAEYRAERTAVESLAARINLDFAPQVPVSLTYADRPRDAVAAALRDADVCVVTSLADGMNLVAKEFVAVQPPEDPGVLILSDTCGAAVELDGALLVRATNVASIEAAMQDAIAMPRAERIDRWRRMRVPVESNTAGRWLAGFLRTLGSGVAAGAPAKALVGA